MSGAAARGRILLLDDDRALRELAGEYLRSLGHAVVEAPGLAEARARLAEGAYDVVLADLVLGDGTGLDLLRDIRRQGLPSDVIIMTGHGGVEAAVEAIQHGAYDFITKPLTLTRLGLDVQKALEKRRLEQDVARLSSVARARCGGLVGASAPMQVVYRTLERAAPAPGSVLLLGESGTGKEVAARTIHQLSPRRDGPFVAVNCGALPEDLLESELFGHVRGAFTGADRDRRGLFFAAAGGTLFLDEIASAPPRVQVGLLRALQERRARPVGAERDVEADVRVIAATNADLDAEMAAGRFRPDLYYRLAGIVVRIPPLRERREDIPLLATEILDRLAAATGRPLGLAPRALERLVAQDWPGNVRELQHALERAVLLAPHTVLGERDLGLPDRDAERVPTLEEVEREHIRAVLVRCAGNKLRAARLLGIPRGTLYRKLERHGLEEPAPVGEGGGGPAAAPGPAPAGPGRTPPDALRHGPGPGPGTANEPPDH